jgi:RNA polymerase sigma factor for flagellar operon FliA
MNERREKPRRRRLSDENQKRTTKQCLLRGRPDLNNPLHHHRTAMITPTTTISTSSEMNNERRFQRLLEDHFPMVQSIVDRMRQRLPNTVETDELHSIGLTGLVAAAQRYQPSRQGSFAAYAATRIRGAILDELRRLDSLSRSSRAKAKRLGSAIGKLKQEQGADYSEDSLCVEMNMSAEELAALMEEVRPVSLVSLDGGETQSDFSEDSLHDIIPDDHCVSAIDALERKEIISLLAKRMAQLPDLQKKVLAMYYYENMQLAEIATIFGLTESRICQIRGEAVEVLRKYLKKLLA